MDSTQKAVKNQEICEPLQGNLGITQSSGLDRLSGYPDKRSNALKVQAAKKNTKVDAVSTYSFDPLTVTINRIYVGRYMGNGKLGAGCKYQIWGIRA